MPKPPPSTPHSDLDGVHRDEERNTDVAADRGESGGELQRAREESPGRPPSSDDQGGGDAPEAEGHPS